MAIFIFSIIIAMIFVCAFGFMIYRHEVEKRAWKKAQSQHDGDVE